MSNTTKIIIGVVVIIIAIFAGWTLIGKSKSAVTTQDQTAAASVAATPVVQNSTSPSPSPTSVTSVPNTAGTGLSASTDTSNTALDQDLNAVGSQLKDLNSDTTNIDQSVSASAQGP